MKTMQSMGDLNSTETLRLVSKKLPSYSAVKWWRHAHEVQTKLMKIVTSSDFTKFVMEEAELANDPIFSLDALKAEKKKNNSQTSGSSQPSLPPLQRSARPRKCSKFLKSSVDERSEIIRSKSLCFGCFKSGHVSSGCRNRSTCKECGRHHHTLLHGVKPRSIPSRQPNPMAHENQQSSNKKETPIEKLPVKKSASSNLISVAHSSAGESASLITHCRIVQVILFHKNDPLKTIKVYALLDDANDTTFVTTQVQRELGIEGVETSLDLSTMLGRERWSIVGPVATLGTPSEDYTLESSCHCILSREVVSGTDDSQLSFIFNGKTKEVINPSAINQMFELDFVEHKSNKSRHGLSKEDRKFLEIAERGIHRCDNGHYELPLPLKDEKIELPNNRSTALHRLSQLKRRLEAKNSQKYKADYVELMRTIIADGYAERVPKLSESNHTPDDQVARKRNVWYIPHHGVYHRKKPNKIRVVFDCAAVHEGESLNKHLLQGPDLTNNLTGVLCRFRQEHMCNIEAMFHQSTANDFEEEFGATAADFVRNDFYVDDGLKSVSSVDDAVQLVKSAKHMCKRGGFRLHKFVSNNKEVIRKIPESDRADGVKELDLDLDSLPLERALGVHCEAPCTRRGILSTVSSVFDPLGFVAPLLLDGKSILHELCRHEVGWDDPIPDDIKVKWENWRADLLQVQRFSIPRCYKPENFGRVVNVQLHHFSDASVKGYGQCSYLRLVDENQRIHCAFVMGKSRVAPLKPVTIPRLELTTAVCSVRISEQLRRELEYHIDQEYFWTDSKVVLGYIRNESRRFHVFVSNRVQDIQDNTSVDQWRYIESKQNPADEASRGMKAQEILDSRWITGPPFIWEKETQWPTSNEDHNLHDSDPEVKAKRAVALCRRYVGFLKEHVHKKHGNNEELQEVKVEDLESAERAIIRAVQLKAFKEEIATLRNMKQENTDKESRVFTRQRKTSMKTGSSLYKLDPFVDVNRILRVGGRLRRATLVDDIKFPIILPRDSHVTHLVAKHYHQCIHHQGKGMTLNEIRSNGFWILRGSSIVTNLISSCVKCQKLRGSVQEQRMSDLPEDRLESTPPFTYCAVHYFGPFAVKNGHTELKRYGVLFTCLASRAIHLEIANSLETDSFLNALRRFISRRGPICQLRSDQGTNFVGARKELTQALAEMDQEKLKTTLLEEQCDWFSFKMNVPAASHMGGAWERQIRSVCNVLSSLFQDNGKQLDDESLRTLMCEAEAIVNSRPLTVNQLADPDSPSPLTPNHLLTMKSKVVFAPPGAFQP
ncbi:hypothetical protein AWC38_SpisGene10528 [Stylophora pistillata]|uniref:Pro-Pol polyprotein n=1 Tax=Stylophora pistillata TaxID=50429 RepID=A0A2B4S4Q8_STYPI|nr:hypothetical protein AWC38_SpisGene10528 [Stylophora pistillata]